MARPKLDSLENWVNIISGVLFTVYILLVWIVNQGIEERVAQELYGLIMAVILITIVGVNLILILYTILKALYMILRDLWEYVGKRAPKKEVPEFEEDLPNDDDMKEPYKSSTVTRDYRTKDSNSTLQDMSNIRIIADIDRHQTVRTQPVVPNYSVKRARKKDGNPKKPSVRGNSLMLQKIMLAKGQIHPKPTNLAPQNVMMPKFEHSTPKREVLSKSQSKDNSLSTENEYPVKVKFEEFSYPKL